MGSKRLDIKIRILLFLLCTIGILYISMKLLYRRELEGFQTYNGCTYDRVTLPGRGMWKCPSNLNAKALLTDTSIPRLNDNDAICYLTANPTNSELQYYTCYQRPAGKTFSIQEGIYIDNNSLEDETPENIASDISQVCGDYGTELVKFVGILQSTVSYQGLITSATSNISTAIIAFSNISTSKCPNTVNNQFCQTLNQGIGIFSQIENGDISRISTQITGLILEMKILYQGQYIPAYAGFNC
jgi:hypothetical protein